MKLIEVIEKYGLEPYTDKSTTHCYVESFYDDAFAEYREKEISLLEIGVNVGGSIKLWKEYFINSTAIVGIDNRPGQLDSQFRDIEGVTYYFEDAYNKNITSKLPQFDIIVDDGAHYVDMQIKALDIYLPLLKDGGIYVIEDIDGSMSDERHLRGQRSSYDEFKQMFVDYLESNKESYKSYEWLDLRHIKNRTDDSLVVVRK
jgi:cephalosporin hydroxylase